MGGWPTDRGENLSAAYASFCVCGFRVTFAQQLSLGRRRLLTSKEHFGQRICGACPASALPIASIIPTLARGPDLATRTSANTDPDAKPIPRLNAFTMIQLLQFAACRRSTVHCARPRDTSNPFNAQPLIYHLTNSRKYSIV